MRLTSGSSSDFSTIPEAMSILSDMVAGMGSAGVAKYLARSEGGTSISPKVMATGRLPTPAVGNGVTFGMGKAAGLDA